MLELAYFYMKYEKNCIAKITGQLYIKIKLFPANKTAQFKEVKNGNHHLQNSRSR